MRQRRVVEEGATAKVFDAPQALYTQELMEAALSQSRFARV